LVIEGNDHVPESAQIPGLHLALAVPVVDQASVNGGEQMIIAYVRGREDGASGRTEEPL